MDSGYPPGTKCVVTWAHPDNPRVSVGDIVTCGLIVRPPGHVAWSSRQKRYVELKRWEQELIDVPTEHARFIHPVDFMRPIDDDTGEEDQEVINQLRSREKALGEPL